MNTRDIILDKSIEDLLEIRDNLESYLSDDLMYLLTDVIDQIQELTE